MAKSSAGLSGFWRGFLVGSIAMILAFSFAAPAKEWAVEWVKKAVAEQDRVTGSIKEAVKR